MEIAQLLSGRAHCIWFKIGAVIAHGASRNGGQEMTIQQIHSAMHVNGMIIVGDDNHFGGTVHSPFSEDEFGKKTVDGTVKKTIRTVFALSY